MAQLITVKGAKENIECYEKAEAVVLFLCKECADHIHMLSLPEEFYDAVAWQIKTQGYGFTDTGNITSALLKNKAGFTRIIFAGIGAGKACTPNHLRIAAGNAARELKKNKIREAVAAAPLLTNPKRGHYLKALAEGLLLGSYTFDKYKSKKKNGETAGQERNETINDGVPGETPDSKENTSVTVFSAIEKAGAIIDEAEVTCDAICHARDLANEPGNVIYPETLAAEALQVAKEYGLEAEVLDVKEMQALGMGAILAVGTGSIREPRMITLKYANGGDKPFIAFVGKGITFDSGGISIKPSDGMGEMKDDMTGAAAVLGAMQAIAALKLPVNILGVMACAENMPSGSAQRPGDIIRAASGKTIEVDNTDAEGRLVLADAVWYACRKGAEQVVDIATLTGAVIIALGEHTSGIVSNNDALAEEIKKAGHRVGEGWWQLPIVEEAEEMLRSSCADIKNSAGRPAGTITGGVFIGQFVDQGILWAHLDIGGTSTAKKPEGYLPEGCTAFGTATLIEYARTL
jgi:leucyl aminopeptidase